MVRVYWCRLGHDLVAWKSTDERCWYCGSTGDQRRRHFRAHGRV